MFFHLPVAQVEREDQFVVACLDGESWGGLTMMEAFQLMLALRGKFSDFNL